MDDGAIDRAKERVEQRAEGAALDGLLVRAREQIEALAAATRVLEERLPAQLEEAVRSHAQPVARNLAEVRGLMNQTIRRLEHGMQERSGAIVYRMEDRRADAATS